MGQFKVVNKSVEKIDSLGLACGAPEFTDDIDIKNLHHCKFLWSPHAHAEILDIDVKEALKVGGVKEILTYKNVPRIAHTTAGQGWPEPSPYDTFMFDKKVRFVGDRVAAVCAETPDACSEALRRIRVKYKVLEPVFDPLSAMEGGAPVVHDEKDSRNIPDARRNIAAKFEFKIENKNWFEEADYVIENTYKMPYIQHCAIEPHIAISWLDSKNRIVIRTATQVPYHVRRIVAQVLNLPVKKIRVVKPRIGGGFGSKQEVAIEDVCALMTLRTGMPVKLEYTRKETFISSRTRHPSIVNLKTGVKKDGTITDIDMEIILNTGAYGSHALTVMMCSGSHTLPMYKVKNNVRFSGKSVYTNLPVAGAFRGYGATQGFFALESQMDIMAERIGMDPVIFRRKNYIGPGEGSPIFKAMGEGREGVEQVITSIGLRDAIKKGKKAINWDVKIRKYARQRGPVYRGLGMACLMQGSGIPEIDMASSTIKMNEDGSFNLLIGATDIGTGSDTILAQIAAEALGVQTEDILVYSSDTDLTPFDVGAYASSTTFVSGGAVKKAAEELRQKILKRGAAMMGEKEKNVFIRNRTVCSRKGKKVSFKEICSHSLYLSEQEQLISSASYFGRTSPPPFAAHFAEVEVDSETGRITVLNYVAAVDCGTAINPSLAEGQNEGAVLQGLGHTLSEKMEFSSRGTPLNASFTRYKIFNTLDTPPIKSIIVPTYEPNGPYGAKSVSEISINGPLAAVANAVYNAVGVRLYEAPFTPDRVLAKIKQKIG